MSLETLLEILGKNDHLYIYDTNNRFLGGYDGRYSIDVSLNKRKVVTIRPKDHGIAEIILAVDEN